MPVALPAVLLLAVVLEKVVAARVVSPRALNDDEAVEDDSREVVVACACWALARRAASRSQSVSGGGCARAVVGREAGMTCRTLLCFCVCGCVLVCKCEVSVMGLRM